MPGPTIITIFISCAYGSIAAAEGLDLLAAARERRLVQVGENVRSKASFICNCCGCCCEAMIATRCA